METALSLPGPTALAVLMLVLAAVMAVNVAIWAVPDEQGRTLVGAVGE